MQDAATRIDLDEDTLALKRKTLERSTALYQRGLIPKEQVDQHELDVRVSQRALERVKPIAVDRRSGNLVWRPTQRLLP